MVVTAYIGEHKGAVGVTHKGRAGDTLGGESGVEASSLGGWGEARTGCRTATA